MDRERERARAAGPDEGRRAPDVELVADAADVAACCGTVYSHPLAELLVGESLHPGGAEATRALLAAGSIAPGDRLLDIGCGLGAGTRIAAREFGACVEAMDASAALIERARARVGEVRIRWTHAALPDIPLPDGALDAVLAECVLSTTARPAALAEIGRLLRPGGRLLLSDVVADPSIAALPAHEMLGAALCVTRAWTPGEPERLLANAGFEIRAVRDASPSILGLIDRAAARADILERASRDLGLDAAVVLGLPRRDRPGAASTATAGAATAAAAAEADLPALASAVRKAVHAGTLRYVAIVAERVR